MTNGKDWMAGQNWITQFQLCCLHEGHCGLIGDIGDGVDAKRVMDDTNLTFVYPIICDNTQWVQRSRGAKYDDDFSIYNLYR